MDTTAGTTAATATSPYTMSISLNVLEHLGIGLYSNVPAVLSEVVANAWDADAEHVVITIDRDGRTITVTDDGSGMSRQDINDKYLKVGYKKREHERTTPSRGRKPMGRKGIGKLSVFSIADVVEVRSVKDGERNGLVMSRADIQSAIENEAGSGEYHPVPVDPESIDLDRGTQIVLREIRKKLTSTEGYLRKRLARRFSVIGTESAFAVTLDGVPVTVADRDYYDRIEFLWYFGKDSAHFAERCTNKRKATQVDDVVEGLGGRRVSGWIGTVDDYDYIKEEDNTIVLLARGKLIQEDLLREFREGGIYSKYLIGEVDADFMDQDDDEDIVTSARQSVKEDDPRFVLLKAHILKVLKQIQREWTELRRQAGVQRALRDPAIREWFGKLGPDSRRYAKSLFGKIEALNLPDPESKVELYRASMLAFEKMQLQDRLSDLDAMEIGQIEALSRLFRDIDDIEAVHYYNIVKGRIAIVRKFEVQTQDAKEKILQRYLFDHLWLLDPSWERAARNPKIEESVTREFADLDANLSSEERAGRIDIRYTTYAGKHIIVELKKYDRRVEAVELVKQVRKYRRALEKCLATKFPKEPRDIEAICVLGTPPEPQDEPEMNANLLRDVGARAITYDELIARTLLNYGEYLDRQREVSELADLIQRVGSETVAAEPAE